MPSKRRRRLLQKKYRLLALSLAHLRRKKSAGGRRYWVHPILENRATEGGYETIMTASRENYPEKYKDVLRMDTDCFDELLQYTHERIQKKDTFFRKAIPPAQRLSITLFYLASGDSFKTLALFFRIGQSTIRKIIFETCIAIWECLSPVHLKTPSTAEGWQTIASDFSEVWNFPNCIGAIDGKHCSIQCPVNTGSEYFNYKKFFSIVLMGVCDANYRFIYVDVGTSGRWSDGGTFEQCSLNKSMVDGALNLPDPTDLPGLF